MPKRQKFPKLPSGYGSIRYLGKGRTLPYAVHPPAIRTETSYQRPKALCYVPDWYTGFAVLTAYHAGTYKPGLEYTIRKETESAQQNLDVFCRRILRDHALAVGAADTSGITFKECFNRFYDWKFGDSAPKKLSASAERAYKSGFKHFEPLHDKSIDSITLDELQGIINGVELKQASRENMVLAAKNIFKYAVSHDLAEKDVARFLVVPDADHDEHGVPFSDDDIAKLWSVQEDPIAEFTLIMIYSGFRISAYKTMEVNLTEKYFCGGVKTKASKGRIVPIHTAILPLVTKRMQAGSLSPKNTTRFRADMKSLLESLRIEPHTPHDCRHTFSRLCESYGVSEADRKRMMGHSFGGDITNGIYGHRTLEELRTEIEKIKKPNQQVNN